MDECEPLPRVPCALQRRLVPRRDHEPIRVHVVRERRLKQAVVNQGLADVARHVISLTVNPRYLSSMTFYDVASYIWQAPP